MGGAFPRTFERPFELWRYSAGPGQLLLRSTKTEACATRIDIGFEDVAYVQLLTSLDRLTIRIGYASELPPGVRQTVDLGGKTVFVLEAAAARGFVVAGYGGYREDDGEFHEPSTLLPHLM
jgi:hypothetical protein